MAALDPTTDLRRFLERVRIASPTSFTVDGTEFPQAGAQPPFWFASGPRSDWLVNSLRDATYQYCYSRTGNSVSERSTLLPAELVRLLSEANASRTRWEGGWQVERSEPTGQVIAYKDTVAKRFWPGEFITDGPGVALRPGTSITVFVPRESLSVQPGAYYAFGETVGADDELRVLRLYWAVTSEGIAKLLQLITRHLNKFQIPFRFKCSDRVEGYVRRDSSVLYFSRRHYRIVVELAADFHREIVEYLRAEPPLFTKALGYGVGFAEDPGTGESFGMHRCRLVAEAMWHAHVAGRTSRDEMLDEIATHFKKNGISLERPYLNPGSFDGYEVPEGFSKS